MAKDRDLKADRDSGASVKGPGERGTAGGDTHATAAGGGSDGAGTGQHHAAKAHGRPASVDTSLPATRAELLALHADARRRRNTAALGSDDFRAAVQALERIEVRIAAIDRAADPPLG